MKNNLLTLFVIFIIISSSTSHISAQKKVKYKKVKNSVEICKTMELINNYLKENFTEEDYKLTGISAFGFFNCVGIMSGTFTKTIKLDTLLLNFFHYSNSENIDYENIRYIIFANNSNDLFTGLGDAIAISGENWKNNINDFDSLKATAIYLKDKEVYPNDNDLHKIIKSIRLYLANSKSYDKGTKINTTLFWRNDRSKRYERIEKRCNKKIK